MTKLITNISKKFFYEEEEFENELLCLVSDDRFELIEMISTQIKKMDRGDSFLMNWVKEKTDEDDDLVMLVGMESGARFTRVNIQSGERTGQGQRCGFLYISGIIDIYMPENARVSVSEGDQLNSGADILGEFVRLPVS